MTKPIITRDENGKLTHYRNSSGYEQWYEYDSNGNITHYRNSSGYEQWYEYDSNGNETHYRTSSGYERWSEYDSNGNRTHYRTSSGYEMWYEYDSNGNVIPNPNKNNITEPKELKDLNIERRLLIEFINEILADDGPCPCDLQSVSEETLINVLRDLIKEKEQLAADAELDACCEWLNTGPYGFSCAGNDLISQLKQNRRPKPTLKSQALKDFETVKKLNPDMLPEILGTIENALKSLPDQDDE